MLIVLTVVGILLTALFIWLDEWDGGFLLPGIITGMGTVIAVIALVCNIANIANDKIIDQKIAMYQEENASIEAQIANCVAEYQQYETKVISEVTAENAMTLVSLYPDLKSDTLVAKQIEIYIANNNAIKSLREEQLDIKIARWWVYFGS